MDSSTVSGLGWGGLGSPAQLLRYFLLTDSGKEEVIDFTLYPPVTPLDSKG